MKFFNFLGKKIAGVRVIPLSLQIIFVFVSLILISGFSTNYINLTLNRGVMVRLMNDLLVKELKEIYTFASNQYDIYQFSGDLNETISSLRANAQKELRGKRSMVFAVSPDGTIFMQAGGVQQFDAFPAMAELTRIETRRNQETISEGVIYPKLDGRASFGVYRYHESWDLYFIRLEDRAEFYAPTTRILWQTGLLILLITIIFTAIGLYLLHYILRFLPKITEALMRMQEKQRLELIDLDDAPNDEISYLGTSFNSLSSSINNLMTIFRSFVTQDLVEKAYHEREIRLEGTQKELAILFSDIKGFTYMTETLGNDIISLLNIHYDRAIRRIHYHKGIVGSIIGDALLSIYGTLESTTNKSLEALYSAYEIQNIAQALRVAISTRKTEIEQKNGSLSPAEQDIYKAVMLEVGVGIDGGEVFYGNIGSTERMTNTVIGDNVNSASRLEGLTRIYHVPIIVSSYIVQEVLSATDRFHFVELDTVQVKGKTKERKVFFPVDTSLVTEEELSHYKKYNEALQAYYAGDWDSARREFAASEVPAAMVFLQRMENNPPPENWTGIWSMQTK